MQDLTISSWNVRGANGSVARSNIRKLVSQSKANILFLQETKCSSWSDLLMNSIWDSNIYEWEVVNSTGNSGGLLIFWKKSLLTVEQVTCSSCWIWCKGKVNGEYPVNLINVYGPHDPLEKSVFWNHLRNIVSASIDEPLCILGDFNSIRSKEDREGCIYSDRDSKLLNEFLEDHNLLEIDGSNFKFTWFGPGNKKSKLDRAIVNDV